MKRFVLAKREPETFANSCLVGSREATLAFNRLSDAESGQGPDGSETRVRHG